MKSYFTRRQLEKLREGRLDAALVILPVSDSDLAVEPLLSEPLFVALPEKHTLARNRTVALSDLKDIPVISFPQKLHPEIFQQLLDCCTRAGLQPKVAHEVTTFPEALPLVAQGEGCTLIRKCFTQFFCRGIALRPIKGSSLKIETGVAYLKRQKTPMQINVLVSSLKQLGRSWGDNGKAAAA